MAEEGGEYRQMEADATETRALLARSAFEAKDVKKSLAAHALPPPHEEADSAEAKFLKPIIFGGLDGVSTIFAFLAGAVGANLSLEHIIALGCAQLFAGAFGMGFGEYLSTEAERQVAQREEAREHWEVEVNPDGEINEMVHIYMGKGLTLEDAQLVANTFSKYKDFWVEHMLLTEIGIMPPEGGPNQSIVQGLIMFFSFLVLGAIPLIIYSACEFILDDVDVSTSMTVTCFGAASSLCILGMVKAKMADMSIFKGGIAMTFQGVLSAGGAYAIGNSLPALLNIGTTDLSG